MPDRPPAPPSSAAAPEPASSGPYRAGRGLTLTSPDQFAPFAARWDALALEAPQRLPMLAPTWVRAYVRHRLGPGEVARVHVALSGPRVVGVLAVVARQGRLGATLAAPHDEHTRSGDALLAPDAPAADLAGLVDAAFAAVPGARSLALAGVRDASRTHAALAGADLRCAVVRDEDERGSFVPIAGSSLEALRATLSDNFRRNLRKAGNRLAKEAGVAFRFEAGADASPATLERFLALEAAGWKGREGTAIAQDPRLCAFYRDLVEGFGAEGRLEWHTLEIGGAPAAMHLGVRFGRALVLLKIAYDERHARLGPGNLLFDRLLEREFEARTVDEVNCTTDMAWHRNWALPRSAYARTTLFPRRALPVLSGWLPAAARARGKRVGWLRRLVGRAERARDAGPGPGADA